MNQTKTVQEIDVPTLRRRLETGEALTVLDVRPAADWVEWAIPGSLHVDAYHALKAGQSDALAEVDLPTGLPVVTVCGSGNVSREAAAQLQERGYETHSLAGGMKAWSLAWNSARLTLRHSDTFIVQVRRTGKGCLSYFVGSHGKAAVIDPALPPSVYVELAEANGLIITHVLETHVHADHLSRGRALAAETGASYYLPVNERVSYPYTALQQGDVLQVGTARFQVLRTPGHTAESSSYLLDSQALFSGDTLFLNSVGRPDLEGNLDEARTRAHHLYHSLQTLVTLPGSTLVLPGHTSSPVPFDEKVLAATVKTICKRTPLLALDEDAFVTKILERLPPTPPNHQRIVSLNESGAVPREDPLALEAGANRCAIH